MCAKCLSVLVLAACGVFAANAAAGEPTPTPLVYITDLYHSPGDPDDHVDLATLLALPEFDIRAILIDVRPPRKPDANPYDPGYITIGQLCYLTGRAFPVAVGPKDKLRSLTDSAADRPASEQAAITLLLKVLRESRERVLVNTTGTCRIIAAAWLREPDLFREKVKAIVVNAGSSGPGPLEHNVDVDLLSYVIVMRSGLPIQWFPCASSTTNWGTPESSGPNNTFYRVPQQQLYAGLPQSLRNWLAYALSRSNRADILRALTEPPADDANSPLNRGSRNLWSTASFMITSGRVLAKTADGWRFVPQSAAPANAEIEPLALIPIQFSITDAGQPTWSKATGAATMQLFQRNPGPQHTAAMAEALNALLRAFPAVR
jgi:rhodanese-related sulfurtransferase